MQRRLSGLVTYGPRQSFTSFRVSREYFRDHGIDLVLSKFAQFPVREPIGFIAGDLSILVRALFFRFDFIVLNSGASLMYRPGLLWLLMGIARARRIPMFMLWRNGASKFREIEAWGGRRFRFISNAIRGQSICHLSISERTAEEVVSELRVPRPVCIYNCQATDIADGDVVSPEDPPIVMNCGSLNMRKRPDLFVEVARLVCKRHETARFVWLGAAATADLVQKVRDAGLESRVTFLPFTDRPQELMKRASVFLLTSEVEAFGLVLAEAMACARTVVTFSGTGASEVAPESGLVFEFGDVDGVAEAILRIVNSPSPSRVNSGARREYLEKYHPSVYARRFATTIRRELQG